MVDLGPGPMRGKLISDRERDIGVARRSALPGFLLISLFIMACTALMSLCAQADAHFYILGKETCPHCVHLKEALIRAYGQEAVTFLEVSHEGGMERLLSLYKLVYPEAGIVGVPFTVVTINGAPMVCAVGDLPLEDWQHLMEEARRVGRPIKVDFSGKVVVLDEGVGREIAQILELEVAGAGRDSRHESGLIVIALTSTFAALMLAALIFIFRGRRGRGRRITPGSGRLTALFGVYRIPALSTARSFWEPSSRPRCLSSICGIPSYRSRA